MESSPRSRTGEIASHIAMILVTVANLIFFTAFYEYIAWYTIEPDGSITRLSLLTDAYFTWLPFPVIASILAITAHIIFIVYDNYWFRTAAEIILYICGIAVTVSLVSIFPFDFSVIPNATAAAVLPIGVTVFFSLLAIFYGTVALVQLVRLIRSYTVKQETG
jgi:hypothetical protein